MTAEDAQGEAERLRRLFGFWTAVEVLSHYSVPAASRAANVIAIRDDGDLPWPVVGDAAAWSTVPHFSVLHGRLRVVRPAARRA